MLSGEPRKYRHTLGILTMAACAGGDVAAWHAFFIQPPFANQFGVSGNSTDLTVALYFLAKPPSMPAG